MIVIDNCETKIDFKELNHTHTHHIIDTNGCAGSPSQNHGDGLGLMVCWAAGGGSGGNTHYPCYP